MLEQLERLLAAMRWAMYFAGSVSLAGIAGLIIGRLNGPIRYIKPDPPSPPVPPPAPSWAHPIDDDFDPMI